MRIEQAIAKKVADIVQDQKDDVEQIAAAKKFAEELGERWELSIASTKKDYEVTDGYNDEEIGYESGYRVVWSQTVDRNEAKIKYLNYNIWVQKHYKNRDRLYRGTQYVSYRMFFSESTYLPYGARAMSRAKTVNEKVDTLELAKINQLAYVEKKKSALEAAITQFQIDFPNAKVTSSSSYESYKLRVHGGELVNYVKVVFENGISVSYKVYSSGELSRTDLSWNKTFDSATDFCQMLSKINL